MKNQRLKIFAKPLLLLVLSGINFIPSARAQEKINLIKISPIHFFMSTMKVDWEHSGNGKNSFIFSPRMTALDQEDEKIIGGGLELGRRTYLSTKDTLKLNGFYAQLSLSYNYYSTKYRESYKIVNSYYYGSDTTYYQNQLEEINQGGADFVLGYQVSFKNAFYIDMFFGGGMRMSISSRGNESYYRSSFLDPGYSGVVPKAGIKLGLNL